MRSFTFLFLLLLVYGHVKAQNIFTALHLNEEREYKTKRPKKIIETNIFFNSSGNRIDKNVKVFDDSGMLWTEERYDESGILKSRLIFRNDTARRLILSGIVERWTKLGYSKETTIHSYDKNFFLIGTTDVDANGKTIMQADIICNDKGHPVELTLSDGDGKLFGKEVGTYLYDQNQAVTSVLSIDGRVLSSDTIKISFTCASKFVNENEVYNANGDLTSWKKKYRNGTETIYEDEYTYDIYGNCTEQKSFKIILKRNGKQKRENDRIFKKEYFY